MHDTRPLFFQDGQPRQMRRGWSQESCAAGWFGLVGAELWVRLHINRLLAHHEAPDQGVQVWTANSVLVCDSCLQDIRAIVVAVEDWDVIVVFEDSIEALLAVCGHRRR